MKTKIQSIAWVTMGLLSAASALGSDQIVHPYQSVRSSGMGGTKLTTGLYDQNFFGNPARVTANPEFRFTLLDIMGEINSNVSDTADLISNLDGSSKTYEALGKSAGKNNHGRVQTTFPGLYFPTGEDGRWAFAFSLITSVQADALILKSFDVSPQTIVDVGPAFTVGTKLLEDKSLSVGLTSHLTYRAAVGQGFTITDFIRSGDFKVENYGGEGTHLDFDLGATYDIPWTPMEGLTLSAGAAINNLLGGRYSNFRLDLSNTIKNKPPAQSRSFGFGVAARMKELWVFSDPVLALEFNDIGNNPDGGMFRLIHIGFETRYGVLLPRIGINQGYWCAGLGLDLKFFTLDLATYGEEMSLNPGGKQERLYAARIAFQI